MNSIKPGLTGAYSTGRTYDKPQILEWEVLKVTPIELEMCIISVNFTDKSRRITGHCSLFVDIYATNLTIGRELLMSYGEKGNIMAKMHDKILEAYVKTTGLTDAESIIESLDHPSPTTKSWIWRNYPSKILGPANGGLAYTKALRLVKVTDIETVQRIANLPYMEQLREYFYELYKDTYKTMSDILNTPMNLLTGMAGWYGFNIPSLNKWSKIKKGRDLFIPGFGGFDIELASEQCINREKAPTVSRLQALGYFNDIDTSHLFEDKKYLKHLIKYKEQWKLFDFGHTLDFIYHKNLIQDLFKSNKYLTLTPNKLHKIIKDRLAFEEEQMALAEHKSLTQPFPKLEEKFDKASNTKFSPAINHNQLEELGKSMHICIGNGYYSQRVMAKLDQIWLINYYDSTYACQISAKSKRVIQLKGANNRNAPLELKKLVDKYLCN